MLRTSCKSSAIWGLAPTIFQSEMSLLLYRYPSSRFFMNILAQQSLLRPQGLSLLQMSPVSRHSHLPVSLREVTGKMDTVCKEPEVSTSNLSPPCPSPPWVGSRKSAWPTVSFSSLHAPTAPQGHHHIPACHPPSEL